MNQALSCLLSLYGSIFETTRNGIFEAPVFIAIGYYFAGNSTSFKLKQMVILLMVFLSVLYFEVNIVTEHFLKVYDYFILLVPTCFCTYEKDVFYYFLYSLLGGFWYK